MTEPFSQQGLKFLDRNPPAFAMDSVQTMAQHLFGVEGDFKSLNSERDQNFRLAARDSRFVLKISNVDEDPAVVDLQTKGLQHVARVDPTVPVPRVVTTKSGQAWAHVEGPDGAMHMVRLLTYLPGTPLGETSLTPALLRNLGGGLARLDKALRGFTHPAARHELLWDLQQAPRLRPHTASIVDKAERATLEKWLDGFIDDVLPGLARLRGQVIHHDANGNNVVISPDEPNEIAGVIDFGDMIHSFMIADPAVSAADLLMGEDMLEPMGDLIAGFDSVLPLEEEEVDCLFDLVVARCALSIVILAWRNAAPDGPGYLEGYGPRALAAMEHLLTMGRAKVRAHFRKVCRFAPFCPQPGDGGLNEDSASLLERRHHALGKALSLSYDQPVHVVRGEGPWLFCADGSRLLDAYNNVPQVGHAHPHVVRAIARQAAALNTNTRYLFDKVVDYAERLVATLPEGFEACQFVNSGSEANDVALRMARLVTGNQGVLVVENAYHGITASVDEVNLYGRPDWVPPPYVRGLVAPDPYRGPFREGDGDLAARYAADADRAIAELAAAGIKPAALMIDSGFTSNGVPEVPEGYLASVAEKVRAAGGVVIADEVQVGFARSGSHFWGILTHGVVPDIVTLGKPIGNGYPIGAVITRRDTLEHFGDVTELFSTFGGNPVGCAAGLAVLDVIEREGLMENAAVTGAHLRDEIRGLMDRHVWIGDVRGWGLLIGLDLVRSRQGREPASDEAKRVINHMRQNGVLVGREGPHYNVLKIRPPLAFQKQHVAPFIEALDKALSAL
ncbi:MAG: aminotransferase class III-fold pyridoxal phosphate-dependent enzyme [Pseudomonadota bacterium]